MPNRPKHPQHAESLAGTLESGVKSIAEAGSDAYHTAVDETKALGTKINRYVRKNPWRSIGIAAGAGVLIGLLLRRKH
jgi:ElaB/YqjD/DUF883 family membrane-anchored ribosome-binding protein